MKEALAGGQFPARVSMPTNEGYGLLLTLYPDTFLYPAAFLGLAGVSMVTAYKATLTAVNIASAFTAYLAASSICGHVEELKPYRVQAGVICGIVYCLFPYRLVNLYIRAALGESLAMIFLPLLLLGLYHVLLGDKRKWYYLTIGAAGILHSHIISTMMAAAASLCDGVLWSGDLRRHG